MASRLCEGGDGLCERAAEADGRCDVHQEKIREDWLRNVRHTGYKNPREVNRFIPTGTV